MKCLRKFSPLLFLLSCSLSPLFSDTPQDTSERLGDINFQAGLGEAIVINLVESLNLREQLIIESEKFNSEKLSELDSREISLDAREIDLNERERILQGRESLQQQIVQISSDWQRSSERLERSQKWMIRGLYVLGGLVLGEGIILLTKREE